MLCVSPQHISNTIPIKIIINTCILLSQHLIACLLYSGLYGTCIVMYILHYTMYTVQCIVYSVQRIMYTLPGEVKYHTL